MSTSRNFLRDARIRAGLESVGEFLNVPREGGVPLARTVVYDSESGHRPPTEATVRAYALVLNRPDLYEEWAAARREGESSLVEETQPRDLASLSVVSGLTGRDQGLSSDDVDGLRILAAEAPPLDAHHEAAQVEHPLAAVLAPDAEGAVAIWQFRRRWLRPLRLAIRTFDAGAELS